MFPGPQYITELKEGLSSFLDESSVFMRLYDCHPVPNSQALKENSEIAPCESIMSVCAASHQLIEMAADHVSLFVKSLLEPIETLGCFTCGRSMLEACSLATWLLDPAIDSKSRIGRLYCYRFEGLSQQLKFSRVSGFSSAQLKLQEDRIDMLEDEVVAIGFRRLLDRNGKRIGLCERMPSTTDMIEDALGEGRIYRMLSAVAHGHHWALYGLGYRRVSAESRKVDGVEIHACEKVVDPQALALLGFSSMKAFARPLWNMSRYFGWNMLEMEELLENVADRLQASASRRFWRS